MTTVLERPFEKMGARLKVRPRERWGMGLQVDRTLELDVRRDGDGEYFDILIGKDAKAELSVLQVVPEDRHLLLLVKRPDEQGRQLKQRFLCGHDERHWFVAAIPEESPVSTVEKAKEALKPEQVLNREQMIGLPSTEKHSRKNAAFKRQGEWFFVPVWSWKAPKNLILKNEPFNRGRGKFHYAQEAYRQGGTAVFVLGGRVLTRMEYEKLPLEGQSRSWRRMMENADLYVRGKITHADHATLVLDGWHKVLMNLESRAMAMQSVRFLD